MREIFVVNLYHHRKGDGMVLYTHKEYFLYLVVDIMECNLTTEEDIISFYTLHQ